MKYLIYCGSGIGDIILILPMSRRIKSVDPKAHITVFTTSSIIRAQITRELLEHQHDIDDFEYYSLSEIKHIPLFLLHLGKMRYDYGFCLQYTDNVGTSKWPYRILKMYCKTLCGIKLTYHPEVKYDFPISRENGKHISYYPLKMLDAIGVANVNINYSSLLDRNTFNHCDLEMNLDKQKQYITLVVGTAAVSRKINGKTKTNNPKQWSYDNWIELGTNLVDMGYEVFMLGGKKEQEEISQSCLKNDVRNFLGRCTISESIYLLNCSDLVIGADTGLMHCAGALNIPTLTLFGCTDYREYLPFGTRSYYITSRTMCSPCFGTANAITCKTKECMKNIKVSEVLKKALEIMEQNSANENQTK